MVLGPLLPITKTNPPIQLYKMRHLTAIYYTAPTAVQEGDSEYKTGVFYKEENLKEQERKIKKLKQYSDFFVQTWAWCGSVSHTDCLPNRLVKEYLSHHLVDLPAMQLGQGITKLF